VKITFVANVLTASDVQRIAKGARNAAGMAFHPVTGSLYFQDNGIDTPGNNSVSLSADELNIIADTDIGGTVENFGFADNYTNSQTGEVVGGQALQPLVAFVPQPLSTGDESEGAADIVFAPPLFPEGLNSGMFIGFHGQFNLGGPPGVDGNEENPLVYVDLQTGQYFHFVSVNEANVGHLDGLLVTDDALFVADFSSNGSMFNGAGAGAGVIYMIKSQVAVAGDDRAATVANRAVTIDVLHNDGGGVGASLSVTATGVPSNGAVDIINGGASLIYTPANGFTGTDSFTYTIENEFGDSTTGIATIDVLAGENYATWRTLFFGNVDNISGKLSVDSNQNGMSNLVEYALGADPAMLNLSWRNMPLNSISEVGSDFHMTYTYRRLKNDATLDYIVQVSTDLSTWSDAESQGLITAVGAPTSVDDNFEEVTVRLTQALGLVPQFIRLKVALLP